MDHLTISPPDEFGRSAVLILHEHWSKFTALFPLVDYTGIEVARALLPYMTRYGPFAELASEPGSAFLAEAVQELNSWLDMQHRVSLVDRHESNGCEPTIKEVVRHVRAIV